MFYFACLGLNNSGTSTQVIELSSSPRLLRRHGLYGGSFGLTSAIYWVDGALVIHSYCEDMA